MAPLTIALPTYHSLTYQVLGTPSEEDLASIANAQAVQFLRTLPIKPKRCVCEIFPRAMLTMAMLAMAICLLWPCLLWLCLLWLYRGRAAFHIVGQGYTYYGCN